MIDPTTTPGMTVDDERLVEDLAQLGEMVRGPGMSTTIRGDQLNGILALVERLAAHARQAPSAAVSWTEPLADAVPVLADIIERGDACGVNVSDALTRWAAENGAEHPPEMVAAVNRALAGGGT